jgi:hypothetical protein
MGGSFSATDYIKTIRSFSESELTKDHDSTIQLFLSQSNDFFNVFTSSTLDDYRTMKKTNANNLVYLISSVSAIRQKLRSLGR